MSKKWKRFWFATFSILLVLCVAVGFWAYKSYHSLAATQKPRDLSRYGKFEEKPEYKPPEWTGTGRVNVLLMGGDQRGLRKGEVARSDSMMVASFDPTAKTVHLFSVLRDTYVDIPDGVSPNHLSDRINAAVTIGGPELAMKTVGNLLGLDIQYYVDVDFQGFIKLVDAVGGIDFYVEKNMRWTDGADGHRYDINLKQGQQHLDGEKALQYVRFRHDAMSDFTRTERQRKFLKGLADKLQSGWNIIRLPDILNQFTPYVETNMTADDMLKLAALGYKSHQAGSAQVPTMDMIYDRKVGGSSVLGIKNLDALKGFVQATLAEDANRPAAATAGEASVSTNPGAASSAAATKGK